MPYVFPSKTRVSLGFPASRTDALPVALSIGPSRTGISPDCKSVSGKILVFNCRRIAKTSHLLTPVGVKKAGMPAPPARILSAIVPWGQSSIAIFPDKYCFSKDLFVPIKERINLSIWPDCTSGESPPPPAAPALFDTAVREWRLSAPLRAMAAMIVSAFESG